jgi:pimeloyl-ACP methyl ester carboxylesterase
MKTTSDEFTVTVGDGVKLTYRVYGKPDAPPMVLVHALFMDAQDWTKIVEAFSDRYRVYALNLRGHGTSDWPGQYSFDVMAQDIVGFMTALKLDRPVLVGHSLGGIVSYFVAATHPDSVSALVLEEAPPPQMGGGPFDFGVRPKGKLPYDWLAITAIVDQLNNPDPGWWNIAVRIKAPTLVIGGGPTSHVPQAWNVDLAAGIPNSHLVTLGGGHFVHQKRATPFIREVTAFLSRLEDRQAT